MNTAIVTGGASGIGRAIVEKLCENNYYVIACDKNTQELEKVVRSNRDKNHQVRGEYVDISSEQAIIELIGKIEKDLKMLTVLINNAGVNFNLNIENCDANNFDECIDINLKGHFLFTKYCLPYLKESTNASIVNISSAHAMTTQNNFFPYNVAKHGIIGLTKSMVVDLSKYNIRANSVCPGLIHTNIMASEQFDEESEYYKKIIKYHPVGRIGQPEDVANLVNFLASEESSFINGASILIDGGRSVLTYDLNNF